MLSLGDREVGLNSFVLHSFSKRLSVLVGTGHHEHQSVAVNHDNVDVAVLIVVVLLLVVVD
jgi:hypothetical protein